MERRERLNFHPLEPLCEAFLSDNDFSPATLKAYRIAYKYYLQYLSENKIEFAKTSDVIKYRENRRALGFSTHYIYVHICALKGLYRYLRINQKRLDLAPEYAYDIMTKVQNERILPRITKPILTAQQAKQLILQTKAHRKSIWDYRNHAIIYLMITSGLSSQEIIQAKREDYQWRDGGRILFVRQKGNRTGEEFVKISKGSEMALDDYLNKRKDVNPYLFVTTKNTSPTLSLSRTFFRRMFQAVLADAGLGDQGITPHCLRHSAATLNLLRGGSLEATRQLMRHKDIQSTLVYARHIERVRDDSENQIEKILLKEEPGPIR